MKERRALSPQPSCFLSGQEGSSRPSASITGLALRMCCLVGGLTGGWQVRARAPRQTPAPLSPQINTQAQPREFHNPTCPSFGTRGITPRYEPRVGNRCQKTLFLKWVWLRDCLSATSVGISQLSPPSSTLCWLAAPSRPSPNTHKEGRAAPALQRGEASNREADLPGITAAE